MPAALVAHIFIHWPLVARLVSSEASAFCVTSCGERWHCWAAIQYPNLAATTFENEFDRVRIAQFRAFLIREMRFQACLISIADSPKPLYSQHYLVGPDHTRCIFREFVKKMRRISE
jgi:hypothetical protein